MHRTRIKICGVTRAEDARVASELGADYVGMVLLADSPRRIELLRAKEIAGALPAALTPVGVFVDAPADVVTESCRAIGLKIAQLHGNESPDEVAALAPLMIWKSLRVDGSLEMQLNLWAYGFRSLKLKNLAAIVLDTASAGVAGGSGQTNDWLTIRAHQQAKGFAELPPIIAAGGLQPGNVGAVVRTIRPWAVDVSSGVESSKKGTKSRRKIADFIAAVRAADSS